MREAGLRSYSCGVLCYGRQHLPRWLLRSRQIPPPASPLQTSSIFCRFSFQGKILLCISQPISFGLLMLICPFLQLAGTPWRSSRLLDVPLSRLAHLVLCKWHHVNLHIWSSSHLLRLRTCNFQSTTQSNMPGVSRVLLNVDDCQIAESGSKAPMWGLPRIQYELSAGIVQHLCCEQMARLGTHDAVCCC